MCLSLKVKFLQRKYYSSIIFNTLSERNTNLVYIPVLRRNIIILERFTNANSWSDYTAHAHRPKKPHPPKFEKNMVRWRNKLVRPYTKDFLRLFFFIDRMMKLCA